MKIRDLDLDESVLIAMIVFCIVMLLSSVVIEVINNYNEMMHVERLREIELKMEVEK